MHSEDWRYLPPDPPTTERVCPVAEPVPGGSPFRPVDCTRPAAPGEVLCAHHRATLTAEDAQFYDQQYAA